MLAYHVITDRPVKAGQRMIFDGTHRSGVYRRVYAKAGIVEDIYNNPGKYRAEALDYPTLVALRELALEEVRCESYPQYPSRLNCLYVSGTFEEAEEWGKYFAGLGRPTYSIVEVEAEGKCFVGDAAKCFDGRTDRRENLKLARRYWENKPSDAEKPPVVEILADGCITVVGIVKEINADRKSVV